jgi:predicted nucleotide-binding protein
MPIPLSRKTSASLANALARKTHAQLDHLFFRYGVDSRDVGGSASKRALALVKALDEQPRIELALQTAKEFLKIWPPSTVSPPEDVAEFISNLTTDGFSTDDHSQDATVTDTSRGAGNSMAYSRSIEESVSAHDEAIVEVEHAADDKSDTAQGSDVLKIAAGRPPEERVFVVHGQNMGIMETVARFLETKLSLLVTVLHEQPNQGKTIIEKFEDHSDVAFAVVLLTADDKGGAKSQSPESQKPRARQNVIFELGFFLAKLGRGKVCALYEEGVEIPSDFAGVLYIPLDNWQLRLARELKAAGLPVDLNRLA